jgi:hypothetical protein
MRIGEGYEPYVTAPTANDFKVKAGHALVEGICIPTSTDEPPIVFDYSDKDYNYIVTGKVTAVGGGAITDSEKNFQTYHALDSGTGRGPCQVVMTSGAEDGNSFDISSYTATQLTLSGGTGSIATDDTFIVVPPDLTTPGESRTDKIYLMVWWEDISDAEDSNIQHPGLGVETCHRSKRRWCVRVAEGVSAPTTPSAHGFGVRYLLLSTLSRTASANIEASMFSSESPGHSLKDIEVVGTFSATALSVLNGGGLGSDDALNTMMETVDEQLVRRRAFSAVLTQGTTTVGGDYDSADAVDNLDTIDGTFFVRRGVYEWNSKTSLILPDVYVIGEKTGSGGTEIAIPSGHIGNFTFSGSWNRVYLDSHNNSLRYTLQAPMKLDDVTFARGACQIYGGPSDEAYSWRGGGVDSSAGTNTNNESLSITDTTGKPNGVIEGCTFYGPPGGAGSPITVVNCSSMATDSYRRPLTFRNCHFRGTGDVSAVLISVSTVPLVFEDCSFHTSADTKYTVEIASSTGVVFRNCSFRNEKGRVAKIDGGVVFESCEFISGTTAPSTIGQMATFNPNDDAIVVRNCYFEVDDILMDPSTGSTPVIEFGGLAKTPSSEQRLILEGNYVICPNTADAHRSDLVAIHGPLAANSEFFTICKGLVVDIDKVNITADRGNNGISTRTAFVSFKVVGSGLVASDIELVGVDNPASGISDNGNLISFNGKMNVSNVVVSRKLSLDTGDFAGTEGLISIQNEAEVHNLRALIGSLEVSTSGTVYVVWLNEFAKLIGAKFNGITGGSSIPDGAFFRIGNTCSLRDTEMIGSLANDFRLMWFGNESSIQGCRFDLTPGAVRSLSTYYDIFGSTGVEASFTSNQYVADGPTSTLNIYSATGDRHLCVGNIFVDTDNTIAPTITVTGTDSVSASNVVAKRP